VNKARDGEFYSLEPEAVVVEPVPLAMMLMSSANGGETSVLYRSCSARTAVRSDHGSASPTKLGLISLYTQRMDEPFDCGIHPQNSWGR
jgi:hypothetical protein